MLHLLQLLLNLIDGRETFSVEVAVVGDVARQLRLTELTRICEKVTTAQTASNSIALLHHLLPLRADELVHADVWAAFAVEHLPDGDTADLTAVGGVGFQIDGGLRESSIHQHSIRWTVGGGG